jgi:hypothetical protein
MTVCVCEYGEWIWATSSQERDQKMAAINDIEMYLCFSRYSSLDLCRKSYIAWTFDEIVSSVSLKNYHLH